MIGPETEIGRAQCANRLQEERRADQDDDRQRDLRGNRPVTSPAR